MSKFLRIAAFTLLSIAGIFVLLLLIAILVAEDSPTISTSGTDSIPDTTSTSGAEPLLATVKVLPGAVDVINENTFPWHGLIVTANRRYSTRHRFGDFNWGFLSKDSVLAPNELIGPPTDAFIDSDGNGVGGKPYTIVIQRVELEARTRADGPYDLKAIFIFSENDPIVNNGITRTNKPTGSDSGPRATPYTLTEEVERLPTFKIRDKDNSLLSLWIEAHEPQYHEILKAVSNYPQSAFGDYMLPSDAYAELEATFYPERRTESTSRRERWDEQWQHWENIDAFKASMESINADRIIDQGESQRICFALDQWTAQMQAAKDYIQDYRRDEPQYAAGVGNLEEETDKVLELLNEADCQ